MNSKDYSLCTARIKAAYDYLTNSEKKIADYILDNYHDSSGRSAAELAELTGTSPATIFRFCRSIGFEGIADFKLSMEKDFINPQSDYLHLENTDSVAMVKQKVLMFNKHVIDGMFTTLEEENLERAADLLLSCNRVLVLGDGGSSCSARNAFDVFLQMGIRCEYIGDPFFQTLAIEQLTPKDMVFAISNSGRSRNTVENLRQARAVGAITVGMVGIPGGAMADLLDVKLHTNTLAQDFFCDTVAARMCELCVISVLHSMLVLRGGDSQMAIYKALGKKLDAKRLKPNEKLK